MSKDHLNLFWDGKTWRAEGHVLGKRIRRSLKIRSKAKKQLAEEVVNRLFEVEYKAGLERQKVKHSPLFSTVAMNYMKGKGYNRYSAYIPKILEVLGPTPRVAGLDEDTLMTIGIEKLPTYNPQSVKDCFVKPAMTIIRYAKGEYHERSMKKAKRPRVLTVEETLELIDAAAHNPSILKWDPHKRTLQKIAFQLGSMASPGETCAVLAVDIDATHQRVTIAGREPGARKNPYRNRDAYLPDFYWNLLRGLPEKGKVFLSPRGKPYTVREFRGGQYAAAFASVVREAGLPSEVTPHDLRHTAASHFYAATKDVKALCRLGGWADGDLPLKTYVELLPAGTAEELLSASIDYGQVLDGIVWRSN
jgi:integrase